MKPAGDLIVHNQKYLPPASAGHAGASTPQEFIHCSPIVSAFLGSFFDPVSTFFKTFRSPFAHCNDFCGLPSTHQG